MVVRKKSTVKKVNLKTNEVSDTIDLTPELERVRAAIQSLDEGDTEVATAKKKATSGAKKKAATKATAKKRATANQEGMISLASLAEEIGISATAARRKLRDAEFERGEGRWAWPKDSGDLKKVREILKPVAAASA